MGYKVSWQISTGTATKDVVRTPGPRESTLKVGVHCVNGRNTLALSPQGAQWKTNTAACCGLVHGAKSADSWSSEPDTWNTLRIRRSE